MVQRAEAAAVDARLAVNADAELHLVIFQRKGGLPGSRYGAGAEGDTNRVAEIVQAAAQFSAGFQRVAALGGGADQFFDQYGVGDAATTGGIEAVFHRHVVVDHHGGDFNAALMQQLGGGLKIQDVAGIVFDNQQDAFAAVNLHRAFKHFVRRRRGEDFPRTGAGEHALADIAAVHRFMSAAAAGEQGHLASHRRVGAGHIQRVLMQGQLRMGFSQPL